MSIESRVEQFHLDAQRPKDNKTEKDIAKLQKFLFKNQDHRFADKEQNYLFQAVQLYCSKYADGEEHNPALPLLEDALKMPFTVFTTSQKKSMLKLLDKLSTQGKQQQQQRDGHPDQVTTYDVLECDDLTVTLMSADGETREVPLQELPDDVRQGIVSGLQADDPIQATHSESQGWRLKVQ